jgi:hypothetical protein
MSSCHNCEGKSRAEVTKDWYCPLYKRDIASGKCLDINFELLCYLAAGNIEEVGGLTGLDGEGIRQVCAMCSNQPFPGGDMGEITFRRRARKTDQEGG